MESRVDGLHKEDLHVKQKLLPHIAGPFCLNLTVPTTGEHRLILNFCLLEAPLGWDRRAHNATLPPRGGEILRRKFS